MFARASLAAEYGAPRDDLSFAEVAYRVQVVDCVSQSGSDILQMDEHAVAARAGVGLVDVQDP